MGEVKTVRTAELIAAEINDIKDRTKKVVIYNSIEIGRRLTEARELVAPGEWGKWLEESVDYKKSTANNLMRIFQEYGSEQLSLLGSNTAKEIYDKLDYSKAVILLGTTEEEKEQILKDNDVEEISSRVLKKIVKELKEAKKDKEIAENRAKEIEEKSNQKIDLLSKEIEELRDRPIEVTGLDESKEELEQELREERLISEELRRKLEDSNKVIEVDDATQRYAIYFSEINDKFDKLLGALEQIRNEEEKEQYTEATKQLLKIMEEKVE